MKNNTSFYNWVRQFIVKEEYQTYYTKDGFGGNKIITTTDGHILSTEQEYNKWLNTKSYQYKQWLKANNDK